MRPYRGTKTIGERIRDGQLSAKPTCARCLDIAEARGMLGTTVSMMRSVNGVRHIMSGNSQLCAQVKA